MTAIRPSTPITRQLAAIASGFALIGVAFVFLRAYSSRPERMDGGRLPEQLIYARTRDEIVNSGVIFTPPKEAAKPAAVIWIHGWGVNFYQPTYVGIGRALAE